MKKRYRDIEGFEQIRDIALEQLFSGKSLTSEGGVFHPIIKDFLESALSAEMEEHLDIDERFKGNKRNGKKRKTLKSSFGQVEIETPQDRHSTFDPHIVKKRETILADNIAPQIIGLYSIGNSYKDISRHIQEMYGTEISASTISKITDRIIPDVQRWRSRELEEIYPVVWLDAMYFKVRHEGRVVTRVVYNALGLSTSGHKDILGFYIAESEGAHFWLTVLTDLQQRGVKDILIAAVDNLSGFKEAIWSIFPHTEVQKCIIHQIRNSMKYIANKDRREFMADLKTVYKASNKAQAEVNLNELEKKWGKKYEKVIKSWRTNWDELTVYFRYGKAVQKIIYTTNTIEGMHRRVRKVTKTKGAFSSDLSLSKLLYLAMRDIVKSWHKSIPLWNTISRQLKIHFADRMPGDYFESLE